MCGHHVPKLETKFAMSRLSRSRPDTRGPRLPRTPSQDCRSHRKWHNPATGDATVIPDWGSKDLKLGTIRAAVRQLGVDWKKFLGRP
jgi:hypothetical protein